MAQEPGSWGASGAITPATPWRKWAYARRVAEVVRALRAPATPRIGHAVTGWLCAGLSRGIRPVSCGVPLGSDGAPVHLAERERAELARQEVLGRVAIALDAGFPRPCGRSWRAPRRASSRREILGDAAAGSVGRSPP